MLNKKNDTRRDKKEITLRDIVVHVGHMGQRFSSEMKSMEQRLSSRMDGMEKRLSSRMDGMEKRIGGLSSDMKSMETHLTDRIDALDEDLTATMHDTMRIRAHVGMPVPTE
ncbi:hypothetical protein HY464_00440 [Candidatus Peregrinibacteria bacterium]|nr:hypothetical protein [Candidatus Peregrinibacteria bacterium]